MVLESTMICLDNSDWMRNGDYAPSRVDAQQDAATMLCNDRLNSNPENTIGILTMGGKRVDLMVSPTEDAGKILASFGTVKPGGKTDLTTAIQIAQLALKHRKNKNGSQRIVVFVGSPIPEAPEGLAKMGKQLKKNNVALDIISMGEVEENAAKLQELVNAVNSGDNSHLITVPAGVSASNALLNSPVMHGVATAGMSAGGENFDMYGGIDPSMDPELAMAIRVSTEEARAHEEARTRTAQPTETVAATPAAAATTTAALVDDDSEEALMQRALEMSMKDFGGDAGSSDVMIGELDEDEELARAIALSVQQEQEALQGTASGGANGGFSDPAFVQQMLASSDTNDPIVQAALAQLQANEQKQGEGKKEDENRKRTRDT